MNNILDTIISTVKKLNRKVVIAVAACAAVACTGLVALGVYANSPKVVAINSIVDFADDLTERDELSTIVKVLKKGSVEASLSKIEVDGENYMEGVSASGKFYFSKDAYMLENLHVKANGVNIEADIYASYDLFYINEDSILGGAYGITPKDLAGDLEDSIFAYGSGSDYEIPDRELYEALLEFAESLDSSKKMSKELQKLAKQVTKDIYKIVTKHAKFESENGKERIGGDKMNVRVVTIKFNEKIVANILKDVYEYLEDDKRIPKFIEKYDDYLSSAIGLSGGSLSASVSASDMYEEFLDQFGESIDDMCDNIKQSDMDLKLEIITPRGSSKLLKLNVLSSGHELISVDFGKKGIKNTDRIIVESMGETVAEYKVKKNNNKEYSAALEIAGSKVFSIKVDKKDGEFDLSVYFDGEEITISGEYSKSGLIKKSTTINVNEFSLKGEGTAELDLTITLTENDRVPKPPKDLETIRDIDDKDVEKWLTKIEDLLERLDSKI